VNLSTINYRLSAFVVVGCVTLARGLAAEGNSSLTESKIESAESTVTAAALLAKNPQPNDDHINQAMAGNICRCGTYDRIRKAIHRAAAQAGGR